MNGIVDGHVHVFPPEVCADPARIAADEPYFALLYRDPRRRIWDIETLIEAMDRDGVAASIVVNFGWLSLDLCRRTNAYLLESAARYAGRVAVCVTAPPNGDAAIDEIERSVLAGAAGIGEVMPDGQRFQVDESFGGALAELAGALDVPLLLHASEPVGHHYPGKGSTTPASLLALIERHPASRFVLAHFGGGLPFYALMPEVRRSLSRVWFDSAASVYLYEPAVYQRVIDLVGADRVLFASDAPLVSARRALNHLSAANLANSQLELIVGTNARMVYFGLTS